MQSITGRPAPGHHYRPNVDRPIACILLHLINLTTMHVGIDFKLVRDEGAHFIPTMKLECVVGRLFGKIANRSQLSVANVYTFAWDHDRSALEKTLTFDRCFRSTNEIPSTAAAK